MPARFGRAALRTLAGLRWKSAGTPLPVLTPHSRCGPGGGDGSLAKKGRLVQAAALTTEVNDQVLPTTNHTHNQLTSPPPSPLIWRMGCVALAANVHRSIISGCGTTCEEPVVGRRPWPGPGSWPPTRTFTGAARVPVLLLALTATCRNPAHRLLTLSLPATVHPTS